jgi:anti-sigma B factor antagonist
MSLQLSTATRTRDDFRIKRQGLESGAVVVEVAGKLDLCSSHTLREHLEFVVSSGAATVVVDLTRLSFIDSTGLGVLAVLARRPGFHAVDLAIVCPEGRIRGRLRATGLDRVMPVYSTQGQALRGETAA